ncbi:hypothetical protein SRHO_G00038670 [Serrasalmus rhombeus]
MDLLLRKKWMRHLLFGEKKWSRTSLPSARWCSVSSPGWNLRDSFFGALDDVAPKLIHLFRKKKGLTSQLLAELLRQTKTMEPTDISFWVFSRIALYHGRAFPTRLLACTQAVFSILGP